jgi:superfamily II DNA helicase RecQ
MQYQTFIISALTGDGSDELNAFLRSHSVVAIEKRFLDREWPQWCFCVEYVAAQSKPAEKRSKVDYKEVLNDDDFKVFAELRDLRKKIAENDGVPVFAVFTNEQLAHMVQNRVTDKQSFQAIPGVGPAKLEKYCDAFLDRLNELIGSS